MAERVVIVGAGALGSHVALLGRNWPEGLRVVDFDRVEQKNTLAQLHARMAVGRNKAQALQQLLHGLYGVRIDAVPHRLTADNAATLLAGAALVIDCTDNAAARHLIQATVRALAVPCLHGALSGDGRFARVVWDEHFVADAEGAPDQPTCEDGERLAFFALAASYVALAAQDFLRAGVRRSTQLTAAGAVRLA